MKYAYSLAAAAALAASATLLAPTASSAMPLGAPGAAQAPDSMIVEAQGQRRHVRSHRGGPRVVHRYRHSNRGWNRGAVIGGAAALGILGAAAAASASPYYGGGYACYIEQRPVHDAWGRYLGVQNVQVCP